MADEMELAAPSELAEVPAIEQVAEETEVPETILDPGEELEQEGEGAEGVGDPAPEFVTFVGDDGVEYQVPKALEGALLKNKDYTTKTQALSEERKALEARQAEIEERTKATDEELEARAYLRSVTAELAEYQKLTPHDWAAHMQTDPLGTQQARMRFEALRDQKAELEGKISQAQTERTVNAERDLANRVQETLDAALKIIPGITAETRGPAIDKLVHFATSEGIPEQVLKANWSPVLLKLLHQAHIGKQAIEKQSAPKPAPAAPVAPLITVRTATSPQSSKSLADIARSDDMEAYAAARAAGRKR